MKKNVWPFILMISFNMNIKHIIFNIRYDAMNEIISNLDKITPTVKDIKPTKCTISYLL